MFATPETDGMANLSSRGAAIVSKLVSSHPTPDPSEPQNMKSQALDAPLAPVPHAQHWHLA